MGIILRRRAVGLLASDTPAASVYGSVSQHATMALFIVSTIIAPQSTISTYFISLILGTWPIYTQKHIIHTENAQGTRGSSK